MTIAAAPTKAQVETGEMYGGGMAERARIIKSALTNIFPLIEKQNVLLVLLNQVMAEIGGWKPGVTSAGGNALQHDVHIRLEIEGYKTEFDGIWAEEKNSKLTIKKSKVSPIMNNIPVLLDITKGGIIDRSRSFVFWLTQVNPEIFKSGAWWSLQEWVYNKYQPYWDAIGGLYPRFRQKELYERAASDQNLVDLLQLIWIDLISEHYVLQAEVCKDYRAQIEARLMANTGVTWEQLSAISVPTEDISTEISEEALEEMSNLLDIDASTGEII